MNQLISIMTLNVGMSSSLAGLVTLLSLNSVDLIFLQEVKSSTDQLMSILSGLGFSAEANINVDFPSSPGTAVIWKQSLPVENVYTVVSCRAQAVRIGN